MTDNLLRESIKAEFSKVGASILNVDILSQCVALATSCNVAPAQLAEIWESHSLNKNVAELNDITIRAFRASVHKDAPCSTETAVITRTCLSKRSGLPMVIPPSKRVHSGPLTTPISAMDAVSRASMSPLIIPGQISTYNERTGAGKVILTFNPRNLVKAVTPILTTPRCNVNTSFATNLTKPYRHMFTPLQEKARVLDNHLVSMGEEIVNHYAKGQEGGIAETEAVAVPRQDKICCIGRICNEAHSGRINSTSVLLEGSRNFSHGERVHLDLSEMKKNINTSFSLFPGQIVAVEGLNVSGCQMVANRICEGAAFPAKTSPVGELMHFHHNVQQGTPIKILSVCGPYTTCENLDYEPFIDLLNVIREEKPDVVILVGPFVDLQHTQVSAGDTMVELDDGSKMPVSFETFFANKVTALLEELFETEESLLTQFVVVPSLDEAVAEWVFPQAPLVDRLPSGGKILDLPNADGIETGTLGMQYVENAGRARGEASRVHLVSNPCTLRINEVVVGVTSTDVLFHMNADETNGNLEPGSRLGRIAQHLLQQRSYYPLFPPAPGINLDLKHMDKWRMPCQPDLLIVPSKLTCFARTCLESTVVINPGHLSKGSTGGTYAMMEIHPIQQSTLETAGDVDMAHSLHDRIHVDIIRI